MDLAKKVSASLVDGKSVGLHSDFQLSGEIPREFLLKEECDVGICISLDESKKPFPHTLNLIPRIVCLGIGCRKGIEAEVIETQAFDVLRRQKVSINAVCGVASVDLKREEKGLLRFAERYRLPVAFYSSDTLNCLPGKYTASAFVEQVSGVDNVCERAAVMLSQNGELISSKTAKDGVTAALAMKRWRVRLCDEE
jgi:cobalt-precorrin 5A hydrolase